MARGVGKPQPPSGASLWDQVSAADKRRIAQWNRGGATNIDRTTYAASNALGPVTNVFKAVPTAASTAEFGQRASAYEMITFFGDDLDDVDSQSMEYYQWNEEGYLYQNQSAQARGWSPQDQAQGGYDASPAPITIVPTSTINPERPRTVAAGYDPAQRKLTVIFRDGTYYNYYEVGANTWGRFKAARSKGRFIAANLDAGYPRGPADVMTIPVFARETVYRFLRTGQYYRAGTQPGHKSPKQRATKTPSLSKSRGQHGGSGVTIPKRP